MYYFRSTLHFKMVLKYLTVDFLPWSKTLKLNCFSLLWFDTLIFLQKAQKFNNCTTKTLYISLSFFSAGIGRTGVLITMETAMCLIECNQPIYPLDIVRTMRDQRAMMIQTPVSTIFHVYMYLLHMLEILTNLHSISFLLTRRQTYIFMTESYYVTQANLELIMYPRLGSNFSASWQVCALMPTSKLYFHIFNSYSEIIIPYFNSHHHLVL